MTNSWGRAFLIAFLVLSSVSVGVFTFYYHKYAKIIEDKLRNGPFANTSMLYAAPQPVMLGDRTEPDEIADYLRRAGYTESSRNRLVCYLQRPYALEINPMWEAYDNRG